MVEIGEVIGLLATRVKDDTKKVYLTAKCKNNENVELKSLITTVAYNNSDGIVMISNSCKNAEDAMIVKKLMYNLFLYQSDKTAVFAIYDDCGKSDKKLIYNGLPKFADIKIYEHNDIVEMIIFVDDLVI